MFEDGDNVVVPDPSGDGEVEATFRAIGDPDEAVEVEIDGVTTRADVAWVSLPDGTTAKVPFRQIRAAR